MRRLGTIVGAAGLVLLGYVGWITADAKVLNASFDERAAPALERASSRRIVIPDGTPLGRLRIPRLGLNVVVAQGETSGVLRRSAGHIPASPWLGEPGNLVIAGHRDTVFDGLGAVRVGDMIHLAGGDHSRWYEVTETMVVDPADVSVLRPATNDVLTLITCYPFGYVGPAPSRFIVRAAAVH